MCNMTTHQAPPDTPITYAPADAADAAKRKRKGLIGLAVAAAAAVALAAALTQISNGSAANAASATPSVSVAAPVPVIYEITGSYVGADLTFTTPTGSSQETIYAKGRVASAAYESGAFLYLSAQIADGTGSVTCSITQGGVVLSTNTAYGNGSIATCKGKA